MRKILAVAAAVAILAIFLTVPVVAYAAGPNSAAVNDGTMTAHMDGMPSSDPAEHQVPGLAQTPFATSEVPGHDHVPE